MVYRSTKKSYGYKLVGTITKGSKVKYVHKTKKSWNQVLPKYAPLETTKTMSIILQHTKY